MRRRLFEPRPRRAGKEMPPPTIELPAGTSFAPQRSRIIAMVIDVFVMIVLLFGVQAVVGDRLVARWYPQEHAQLTAITDDPPGNAKSQIDTLKDKADAARQEGGRSREGQGRQRRRAAQDGRRRQEGVRRQERRDRAPSKKVAPAGIVVLEGIMLACLAYLVVPSALIGQTLGKRIQKLRVIRLDGSPLGWGGALDPLRADHPRDERRAAVPDPRRHRHRDRLLLRVGLDAQPEPHGSPGQGREDRRRRGLEALKHPRRVPEDL